MDLRDVSFMESVVEPGCSVQLTMLDLPAGAVPTWLEVPDELADHFVVTDLRVGLDSQLCSTGAVPAALFARGAPRDELLLDPVRSPRDSLSVAVTNLGPGRMAFSCRPIFSDDSRLARYGRARVVGLGVSWIAPLGSMNVNVEPQRRFVPDRLFVPRSVLERVDVEGVDVFNFDLDKGSYDLVETVSPGQLTRESLLGDGLFHLSPGRSVGPRECLTVRFRNRTDAPVDVLGVVLGADPLP